MATRFLATVEAPIHRSIKEHMILPEVDERSTTVVLGKLSNATRVFKNTVSTKMREIEDAGEVDFSQLAPYASGVRTKKMWRETGDWDDSMWSCGQSLGLINDIPTCAVLLARMIKEAEERLQSSAATIVRAKL